MKIDYDPIRDLLYLYFLSESIKVGETKIISPGVHADFDKNNNLIGIEVLEASKILGNKIEFQFPEYLGSNLKRADSFNA